MLFFGIEWFEDDTGARESTSTAPISSLWNCQHTGVWKVPTSSARFQNTSLICLQLGGERRSACRSPTRRGRRCRKIPLERDKIVPRGSSLSFKLFVYINSKRFLACLPWALLVVVVISLDAVELAVVLGHHIQGRVAWVQGAAAVE
jgi:hypothetical protein